MAEGPTLNDGRSARDVERDIAHTRTEMGETIDALEDKLSPGQLLDQVTDMAKHGALTEQVREHPVPLVLIGAGVAWLLVENLTGTSTGMRRRPRRMGDYQSDPWQSGSGRDWSYDDVAGLEGNGGDQSMKEKMGGALDSAKEHLGDAAGTARSGASSVGERAGASVEQARRHASDIGHRAQSAASHMGDRASQQWSDARHSARRGALQVRRGFWDLMNDNPLAMGGVAAAIGFIAGLAAPSTHLEDELMGDVSSTVKHHVKDAAREASDKAGAVARDATEAARRETERGNGRSLAEKAKDAAKEAAGEARSSAERRDLTPERAREKAQEAAKDTRRTAEDAARDKKPGS